MSEIIELVTRDTVVVESGSERELLIVESQIECEVIEVAEQGPPGAPVSGVSVDPNNALRIGLDGGVWAQDELPIDPVLLFDNALI